MGDIFSNVEGIERNYNADLADYELKQSNVNEIDFVFDNIKDIGSFYQNNYCDNLQLLWHRFCYKHKLIVNKIRFESFQILYNKFNTKYEIGFNGLWHLQNNEKIPIQCFKLEKNTNENIPIHNKSSSTHSYWYMYVGIKPKTRRISDMIRYLNTEYALDKSEKNGRINKCIMCILCSYLPSNHILNYNGPKAFNLCNYTVTINKNTSENDSEFTESMNNIHNLTKNKKEFMSIINVNVMKLLMCDYGICEHELLQFVKYLLLFFYHKCVDKWIKQKCNYRSNKYMNNALIEVTNIWNSYKNHKYIKVK